MSSRAFGDHDSATILIFDIEYSVVSENDIYSLATRNIM